MSSRPKDGSFVGNDMLDVVVRDLPEQLDSLHSLPNPSIGLHRVQPGQLRCARNGCGIVAVGRGEVARQLDVDIVGRRRVLAKAVFDTFARRQISSLGHVSCPLCVAATTRGKEVGPREL